jgi:hypothetical protein
MTNEFYTAFIPGEEDGKQVAEERTYTIPRPEGCKPQSGNHPYGTVVDLAAYVRVKNGGRL